MNKTRVVVLIFLVTVFIHYEPAMAVTCKDAKKTVKSLDLQITSLNMKVQTSSGMVDKLQSGTLMTKELASKFTKDCLVFMKGASGAKNFCNYNKDIGKTTYTCMTNECLKYLKDYTDSKNRRLNLIKDKAQIVLNSKECFTALEVLNAQKVS